VTAHDVRTMDERGPLLADTRAVALLGEKSSQFYCKSSNDTPGYPLSLHGIRATAAFDPQDCNDPRYMGTGADDEHEEAFTERDSKERIPTRRKNRRFWTAWHLQKLLRPIPHEPPVNTWQFPPLKEAIAILDSTTDQDLYLDIETSRLHRAISCVGFSTTKSWPRIAVVPYYLYDGTRAYNDLWRFHWALSKAFTRNQVVIHNASFDLTVLHCWYKTYLPGTVGGCVYDTMVANHRCFPEIEKSLAHVISQWTGQPYHKDLNTDVHSFDAEQRLWEYNARDVYNLKLIKDAQQIWANGIPGLRASIDQVNDSLPEYIACSLKGMPIDLMKLSDISTRLTREKTQYNRIASTLVGAPFNPGSTQQCAKFFHNKLNYPIISKTAAGAPALGRKQLYQLALKHDNPLIPVIIRYREVAKDLGMLESELL
jgi:DNA polymerase I-like protein with 3'-5' exonuclease and polymerase domains